MPTDDRLPSSAKALHTSASWVEGFLIYTLYRGVIYHTIAAHLKATAVNPNTEFFFTRELLSKLWLIFKLLAKRLILALKCVATGYRGVI